MAVTATKSGSKAKLFCEAQASIAAAPSTDAPRGTKATASRSLAGR
jgi:hypothetical protein